MALTIQDTHRFVIYHEIQGLLCWKAVLGCTIAFGELVFQSLFQFSSVTDVW